MHASAIKLLNRLQGVKRGSNDGHWMAYCPAHDDHKQRSLSVTERGDKVLIRCFVECSAEAIIAAVQLEWSDLFADDTNPIRQLQAPEISPALAGRARVTARFVLPDLSIAEHKRLDLPDGKRIWWERNGKNGLGGLQLADLPFYGYDQLTPDAPVLVCEGEKAADAIRDRARALGYDVVGTVCGASSIPGDAALAALGGRCVTLWPDNDAPGRRHMDRIAHRLATLGEWPLWIAWGDAPIKGDAADFDGDLGELLGAAYLWNEGDMPAEEAEEPQQASFFRTSTAAPWAVMPA